MQSGPLKHQLIASNVRNGSHFRQGEYSRLAHMLCVYPIQEKDTLRNVRIVKGVPG